MDSQPPSVVTQLLHNWRQGDRKALDALLPMVYDELHRLAHFHLRRERPDHTLQSKALVHEAYLRLMAGASPQLEGRTHFLGIAAQLMRQILVDYARHHRAAKRGGSVCKVSLEDAMVAAKKIDLDVVSLDDALQALAAIDARQARVVELRYFGGLSLQEIATVMEIGSATVQRDWTAARAWLHREMSRRTKT